MTDFALCLTCPEITTGRLDSSKGWLLDASSNHHHCDVKPLRNPSTLPAPIRNAILRLGAGLAIRDSEITMLKLGLHLEDEWTPHPNPLPSTAPAAASTSTTSPAPAPGLDASTRSPLASAPISATSADDEQMSIFEVLGVAG